jgi:hypothetical protein
MLNHIGHRCKSAADTKGDFPKSLGAIDFGLLLAAFKRRAFLPSPQSRLKYVLQGAVRPSSLE